MKTLTSKQEAILSFIEKYWEEHSLSPSYKEIQDFFEFRSPNAVTKHITALVKKKYITLRKGVNFTKARSIIPLRIKDNEVPLVGKIVAGVPVESIENIEGSWDLSTLGIDNSEKNFFALTVRGESMIGAHIIEGDIVIIKKQQEILENEIAAVLWNQETTLKYVKKKKNMISLVPANESMYPIDLKPENTEFFQILGKVVTVIRHYKH
jgi:repressor LexA